MKKKKKLAISTLDIFYMFNFNYLLRCNQENFIKSPPINKKEEERYGDDVLLRELLLGYSWARFLSTPLFWTMWPSLLSTAVLIALCDSSAI